MPRLAASPTAGYASAEATRKRLLEAALSVFSEKGYRHGTIRDICRRAGVNGAMANYHFGSKEGLYRAALREAFVRRQSASPVRTDAEPPRDAAEARARIREIVAALAAGLLSRDGDPTALLLLREMTEPSAALDDLVEELVRPRFEALRAAVRVLSPGASEREVSWTTFSVFGQVVFHKSCGAVALRLLGEPEYDSSLVAEIAERVTAFTDRALGVVR